MFWKSKQKSEITPQEKRFRHAMSYEPVLGVGVGYEYTICSDRDCESHKHDKRFVWGKGWWELTKEVQEEGRRLKEEYFKKYGDYGPARGRSENDALIRQSKFW